MGSQVEEEAKLQRFIQWLQEVNVQLPQIVKLQMTQMVPTDPADKEAWKDNGMGQLSIKCKKGRKGFAKCFIISIDQNNFALFANMSEYENVVGGKLKLKGKALDVKAGGVKKKNKQKKQFERISIRSH